MGPPLWPCGFPKTKKDHAEGISLSSGVLRGTIAGAKATQPCFHDILHPACHKHTWHMACLDIRFDRMPTDLV